MKLPTTNSLTNGYPLVITTQTQQPTARLLLRNAQGQVVQQWLVKQNKCTLGSAPSCSLRCQLSGVAPYHALLVIGARQIFIRALAPKLTRDGHPFNELLLTDGDSHFELAGHRFELTRNSEELRTAARPENSSPERIKFTLARPFELRNRVQTSQLPVESEATAIPLAASLPGVDSKWVAQLIQAAMQPLECQLHNLIEPLSELQNESRKQRRLRKKRALRKRNSPKRETNRDENHSPQTLLPQFAQQVEETVGKYAESIQTVSPQFAQQVEQIVGKHSASIQTLLPQFAQQVEEIVGKYAESIQTVSPQFAQQVEQIVGKHSASVEVLTERMGDVNQQLSTIERLIAEDRALSQEQIATRNNNYPQLVLQSTAIEQLQHEIVTVSSALERLHGQHTEAREDDQQWKTNLQSQLESLTQVIDGLSSSVAEVYHFALRVDSQSAPSQIVQSQPLPINQPWPAHEENEYEENRGELIVVAEPVAIEALNDALGQDEFQSPSDTTIADNAFPNEAVAEELEELVASDGFEEFSQLQSLTCSSVSDKPVDDRGASELSHGPTVENDEFYVCQNSASDAAEVSGFDGFPSSRQFPESEMFQCKVAEDAVTASGLEEIGIAINEVATSEVAECEVAECEVSTSEVPVHDLAEDDLAEREVILCEQVVCDLAKSDVAVDQQSMVEEPDSLSSSLPAWWVDDELGGNPANLIDAQQPIEASNNSDSIIEPVAHIAPEVSLPAQASDSSTDEPRDEPLSEEFYGLAQLDLEDHVREAEPLPRGAEQVPETRSAEEPSSSQLGLPLADSDAEEDGSVEEYMRKLLARMRGVPEGEVELPKPMATAAPSRNAASPATSTHTPVAAATGHSQSSPPGSLPAQAPDSEVPVTTGYQPATQAHSVDATDPFDPEKYMPRAAAPEHSRSLAAMRELANSSARTAIHKSTRQRHVSSILLKAVIALVGLAVGMVLLAINGVNMNIGLVATIASFLVAIVWGYDTISSIRPMLQNGLILMPQPSPPSKQAPLDEVEE